jgi:hypothetical protein
MGDESGQPGRITWNTLNLFASEHFVITTYLDDAEIHRRLEEVIAPFGIRTFFYNVKPYIGKILADGFRVERIFYGGGGAPMVAGRFWNDGEHTLVDIRIAQQRWNTLRILIGLAACISAFIFPNDRFFPGWIALIALSVIFVIIPMYTREIGRSKRFFRELLEDIGEEQ